MSGQLIQEGSYVRSVVLLEIRTMQKLDLTGICHYFPSSSSSYYYLLVVVIVAPLLLLVVVL